MTARKQMPAAQLRVNLKACTERMQELRAEDRVDRDRHEKNSPMWRYYDGRVRAHTLSLHALFTWTYGEFGEDFEGGAQ